MEIFNILERQKGLVTQISVRKVVISQMLMVYCALSAILRVELVADHLKMNAQVAQEHKNTSGSRLEPAQNSVLMVVFCPIQSHFFVLTVTLLVKLAVGLPIPNV